MKKVSKFKRALSLFFAIVLAMSLTIVPSATVLADDDNEHENNNDMRASITVWAIRFGESSTLPIFRGNGTVMDPADYQGGTPEAKVPFVIMEVKSNDTLPDYPTLPEAQAFYEEHKDDPTYFKVGGEAGGVHTLETSASGNVNSGWMPMGKYLIYQYSTTILPGGQPNDLGQSLPVVVNIPQPNPDGVTWNHEVNIYTKNANSLGAARMYKYDGAVPKAQGPLAGATFALYSTQLKRDDVTHEIVRNPDGTPIELATGALVKDDLVTDHNGYTPIVGNLNPGDYYFIERNAPNGYLPRFIRQWFTVTDADHAYDSSSNIINEKVINVGGLTDLYNFPANYKAPTINKFVQGSGTTNMVTQTAADVGQTNVWEMQVDIPLDLGDYTEFIITDTIDTRLDYLTDVPYKAADPDGSTQSNLTGIKVQKLDATANKYVDINPAAYQVTEPTSSSNDLTITLKGPGFGGQHLMLTDSTKLRVLFTTRMNGKAEMDTAVPNSATLSYNNGYKAGTTNSTNTPTVISGGYKFLKTDNKYNKPLANAEFQIYRVENGTTLYYAMDANSNVSWVTDVNKAYTFVSNLTTGKFEVKGLYYDITSEHGTTYYLKETKAPVGYIALAHPVTFEVKANTYSDTTTRKPMQIANSTMPNIPVTGGMGTVIFFVGGGLLMALAAFILLKNKKKPHASK